MTTETKKPSFVATQKQLIIDRAKALNLDLQCNFTGDPTAEIAIIAEYPGEQEVIFNKPLVGGTGKKLREHLKKQKIDIHNCYITNAIKRRVTPNTPANVHEKTLWQSILQAELAQLPNIKYILVLGNHALEFILNSTGIDAHRGSIYDYENAKVYVANNPAIIFRDPTKEIIFSFDMEKFKTLILGDYKPHFIEKKINPSYDEAMQYISEIKTTHKQFATDIEVTGMETACIGLAHSENYAMCINFRDATTNRYTIEQEYNLLRAFADLCDDPTTECIAQNGNFDSYFMGYKDNLTFKVSFDTLLAHHTLYPTLPHNLGFLTSQYTTHPYYKEDKAIFKEGGDIDSFWEYNCTDCAITFTVAQKEKQELKDQGLYDFFINHVMRIQPHLSYTTATGVKVNLDKKEQLSQELGEELKKLENLFHKAVHLALDDDSVYINPSSPKQLTNLLFDQLNLKAKKRSSDANTREQLLTDRRTDPFAKNVLLALEKYAKLKKFVSTYVNTKIDSDGRYRSEFKQYGVQSAPGRLSSGKTLWGSGGNSQNQPRRAYEMYQADEGCVLIYFDLAQAEARYVAWDAWIEKWIEDFERARFDGSFDAHRSLASTMFKIPYDDVPKKDETEDGFTIRYIAKRCRHGLNYRMQPGRLAQTTGLSYGEAVKNYQLYHQINPELKVWWDALEREVKKSKMQFNSYGRRNLILGRVDHEESLKSIVAFKPQSSIGDKVQKVWYQCHEDKRWDMARARIAINVHDALYGIATPSYAPTALSIMKAYAEEPMLIKSTVTGKVNEMIVPADMKISQPNEYGQHLMSNMKDINIEAAKI